MISGVLVMNKYFCMKWPALLSAYPLQEFSFISGQRQPFWHLVRRHYIYTLRARFRMASATEEDVQILGKSMDRQYVYVCQKVK